MQPESLTRLFLALLFFAPLSVSMVCAQGGASASQSVTVSIPPSVSQDGFTGSVPAQGLSPTPVSISFLDAACRHGALARWLRHHDLHADRGVAAVAIRCAVPARVRLVDALLLVVSYDEFRLEH